MSDKWPRARTGFLQGAGLALLIGVVLAVQGAVDGEPAVITLALGGMSLSIVAALLAVDRLYPGLERSARTLLLRAFLGSVAIYLGLLVLGTSGAGSRALLVLAGIPATLTGAYALGLVLRSTGGES